MPDRTIVPSPALGPALALVHTGRAPTRAVLTAELGVTRATAGAVAAILLRGQRANRFSDEPAAAPPVPPASGQAGSDEPSETAQADVNGQVRTP